MWFIISPGEMSCGLPHARSWQSCRCCHNNVKTSIWLNHWSGGNTQGMTWSSPPNVRRRSAALITTFRRCVVNFYLFFFLGSWKLRATPSIKEREFLLRDTAFRSHRFTPRPIEKLAMKRLPRSDVHIECNHILRSGREESVRACGISKAWHLWLAAGKHSSLLPSSVDSKGRSNVWKGFRQDSLASQDGA